MKKQHLVIAVVLILALGAGVYVWEKQRSEQNVQEQLKEDIVKTGILTGIDTSDWKTYRNEKYGYSFRYPDILNVFELAYGGGYANEKSKDIFVSLSNPNESYEDQALDVKWAFSIGVFDGSESLDSFIKKNVRNYVDRESVSIGGLEVVRYISADENQDLTFIHRGNAIFLIRQTTKERNIGKTQELQREIIESFSWM